MKKSKVFLSVVACAMSVCCAAGLAACTPDKEDNTPHTAVAMDASKTRIEVKGYEWGPAIPKVIVEFKGNVTGVTKDTFSVKMGKKRTVTDAYVCDKDGNKTTQASKFVAIEMSVKFGEASPFNYDQSAGRNVWNNSIPVTVTVNAGKSIKVGDTDYLDGDKFDYTVTENDRSVPQTATWNKDKVEYKEGGKDITLSRASWKPAGADTDNVKNPLIIWLHGGGEGGTDIDIALLGNEVTGLTSDNDTNVQSYFKTGGSAGAYVLAVQSPTMWMDEKGDGKYGNSAIEVAPTGQPQTSYYTEALWKAITTYVDGNPDIDTDRIYVGGCSNGGYMTMNLAFEHGDFFAGYYPVCQGYKNGNISDDMIESIKNYNIWFLLSQQDNTLKPDKYTIPLYVRLMEAGSENVHLTYKKNVTGTDDPNPSSGWGTPGFYDGHWSWIYAFNDEVKNELDTSKVNSAADVTPENCTKAGNMWEWMAAQKKSAAVAAEDYTFEAESAVITDGTVSVSPGWGQPAVDAPASVKVETGTKYTGDGSTGEAVTNLGYFYGEGTKAVWTVTAAEECDVVITLHAAAAVQDQSGVTDWTTGAGLKFKAVDLSQNEYVKLSVNGTDAQLTGTLPGLEGLNWESIRNPAVYANYGTGTVKVHLTKGENVITLSAVKKDSGINIDKIVISSPVALTYTPADNSARAPQQPQG